MSDESIKPPSTPDNSLNPGINYIDNAKIRARFDGSCLKQVKLTFAHKKVVNIYIVYQRNLRLFTVGEDFVLENSLFGAVKLTTNAGLDKYKYFGYGFGFEAHGTFSLSNGSEPAKNLIIFGVDMNSLVNTDKKKKDRFGKFLTNN